MPRAATASARACFSSATSKDSASSAAAAGVVVPGLAPKLSDAEKEANTPRAAGAGAAVGAGARGAGATGELGTLVRRCWCWSLDASPVSSSEVGVRLCWRWLLLLPLPPPPPEEDLTAAAETPLDEVGGQGLELDGLFPLCPMNIRIWVYLGFVGGGEAEGRGVGWGLVSCVNHIIPPKYFFLDG